MKFRPRYSLLAFLLFTAFVAGGVKLWRGPHRSVMSEPPTDAEQAILNRAAMADMHAAYFLPLNYQYDYVRSWDGPDCSTIVGTLRSENPVQILPTNDNTKYVLATQAFGYPITPPGHNDSASEYVVCWVQSGSARPSSNGAKLTLPSGQLTSPKHRSYYITSKRRLFMDLPAVVLSFFIKPIELAEVPDPVVQARIAEELAKLPAPQ